MKKLVLALPLLSLAVLAAEPVDDLLALGRTIGKALREGRQAEALEGIRKLVSFPGGACPFDDPNVTAVLKDNPEFQALEKQYERDFPRVVASEVAFSVTAPDLVPEGLAFDPGDRVLYLGSMPTHQVLRLTLDGKATTLVPSGQDGLAEVIGIRVDPRRRLLWAASISKSETAVFAFDLGSGKARRKATLPREGHLLNDLVVTPSGDVVVTDSDASKLYRLRLEGNTLEELPVAVRWPNGIAISPDGSTLYVAEVNAGILRVDLATLKAAALGRPETVSLLGIDGLYAREGELVAVHNWHVACQVARYRLNASGTAIERVDVLERRDPRFRLPTTGAVVDGWFYFMANPQLDRFKDEGITPGPPLEPILVLRTKL